MSEPIQQEVHLDASPEQIFEVLTDATTFSKMSGGAPASIDARAGGEFSCFGGMIHGRILETEKSRRLVQAWRAKNWAPGHYSIVKFEIEKSGQGSKVTLVHDAFPHGQSEHLAAGWDANYWVPMRALLES